MFRAMKNNIDKIRKQRGLTLEKLAEKMGTTKLQVFRLKEGQRKLTTDWLQRFAEALNCKPTDLISENNFIDGASTIPNLVPMKRKTVPVVAYVGAGQIVYAIDDNAKGQGMEEVDCPPGIDPDYVIALKVQGDSMYPKYESGEILYYRRDVLGMNGDCLNKICVLGLRNGQVLVKKLRKGTIKNRFNLESYNAPTIENAEVEWCAPVLFTKPA